MGACKFSIQGFVNLFFFKLPEGAANSHLVRPAQKHFPSTYLHYLSKETKKKSEMYTLEADR